MILPHFIEPDPIERQTLPHLETHTLLLPLDLTYFIDILRHVICCNASIQIFFLSFNCKVAVVLKLIIKALNHYRLHPTPAFLILCILPLKIIHTYYIGSWQINPLTIFKSASIIYHFEIEFGN